MQAFNPREVRVLIVDDDTDYAYAVAKGLQSAGIQLSYAVNRGELALDWLRANDCDVVVQEALLPGITGIKLLEEVRSRHPEVIPIVLARKADVAKAVAMIKAGAQDFLLKDDFATAKIVAAVQEGLRLRGAKAEATEREVLASDSDKVGVAILESQWVLQTFRGRYYLKPPPRAWEDPNWEWAETVEEFTRHIEVCLRIYPSIVTRDEDALVRLMVERGLSPRDVVVLYQLSLYALKYRADPYRRELPTSPVMILVRILARMIEEYQRALSFNAIDSQSQAPALEDSRYAA